MKIPVREAKLAVTVAAPLLLSVIFAAINDLTITAATSPPIARVDLRYIGLPAIFLIHLVLDWLIALASLNADNNSTTEEVNILKPFAIIVLSIAQAYATIWAFDETAIVPLFVFMSMVLIGIGLEFTRMLKSPTRIEWGGPPLEWYFLLFRGYILLCGIVASIVFLLAGTTIHLVSVLIVYLLIKLIRLRFPASTFVLR